MQLFTNKPVLTKLVHSICSMLVIHQIILYTCIREYIYFQCVIPCRLEGKLYVVGLPLSFHPLSTKQQGHARISI